MKLYNDILDRIAVIFGVWALRRLYGANCDIDVRDEFPDDPSLQCISCDAGRLVKDMQTFFFEESKSEKGVHHPMSAG